MKGFFPYLVYSVMDTVTNYYKHLRDFSDKWNEIIQKSYLKNNRKNNSNLSFN